MTKRAEKIERKFLKSHRLYAPAYNDILANSKEYPLIPPKGLSRVYTQGAGGTELSNSAKRPFIGDM